MEYGFLKTLIVVITVVVFSGSMTVWAQDNAASAEMDSNWLADEVKLKEVMGSKEITGEEQCETVWNILWPWAKQGNYEARQWFALLLLPMPHGHSMAMPTGEKNRTKDGVIMAAHSLRNTVSKDKDEGIAIEDKVNQSFLGYALIFMTDEALKLAFPDKPARYFRDEQLLRCIAIVATFDEPIEQCISSAVEEDIFPTFESYAKKIDEAIAEGKKAKCNFKNRGIP